MKQVLLIVLTVITLHTSAQKIKRLERTASYATLIIGDDFEGVLFDEGPLIMNKPDGFGHLKRYDPIVRDALFAEEIIHQDQKAKSNYVIKNTFVKANLQKYVRQYAGYLNDKGEKIIQVNLAWKKSIIEDQKDLKRSPEIKMPNWKNEWYEVLDGGNHYGTVVINISTKTIISFGVHGLA